MLYMMFQHIIEIDEPKEEKFLIKVGYSSNIKGRRNSYKSDNPSARMVFKIAGSVNDEVHCHRFLDTIGKVYCGEWYSVSKEKFKYFLKNGFHDFPTYEGQSFKDYEDYYCY